jgi:hypothetical protein
MFHGALSNYIIAKFRWDAIYKAYPLGYVSIVGFIAFPSQSIVFPR